MRKSDLAVLAVIGTIAAGCASAGSAPIALGPSGRVCSVAAVDSTFASLGTVYRDCDVDRAAVRTATGSRPDFSGVRPQPCMSVDLEFVVDENGKAIPQPLRVVRATSHDFADAMAATIPGWRYSPAMKDGHPVRQLVLDHEAVETYTQRVTAGSTPQPPSAASRPLGPNC